MYWVYILECEGGKLYTGIAKDVDKRFEAHVNNKGAKFTKSFLPIQIIYRKYMGDKSNALKEEWRIKKLSHIEKLLMINKDM
jgi:predicted GIY-YIG superfamily endonuclease